jgi:hypothetical protein
MRLTKRLAVLEKSKHDLQPNPYDIPRKPGQKWLSVLVQTQEELDYARAQGYEAELDTIENCERFLG